MFILKPSQCQVFTRFSRTHWPLTMWKTFSFRGAASSGSSRSFFVMVQIQQVTIFSFFPFFRKDCWGFVCLLDSMYLFRKGKKSRKEGKCIDSFITCNFFNLAIWEAVFEMHHCQVICKNDLFSKIAWEF